MATLTATKIAKIAHEPISAAHIIPALRPWRRRLTLQRVFFWCLSGILCGLILASIVFLIARLVPWATAPYWAIGLGSASTLCTLAAALWLRPSLASTAHTIDERLSFHDRISTAWELREQDSVLHRLQRSDALTRLRQYTPRAAISLRLSRSRWLTLLIAAVALTLLIALPNPMNAVLQQQAAFQNQIAQQVKAIDSLRQQLEQQNGTTAEQKQQTDQILKDLQTQLKQAKNQTEAQQAIAQAQSKLDQLRDPQAANRTQAQSTAATSH
ncbi:MAG: hypothetical protein J2P36_05295, partial [Ktedonobacteraceae bacterium]|nr:hypothetical protein [Ktedonobacteraceae bacterium]